MTFDTLQQNSVLLSTMISVLKKISYFYFSGDHRAVPAAECLQPALAHLSLLW